MRNYNMVIPESSFNVLENAELAEPKLIISEKDQAMLILEHETNYDDIHRKFKLRKNLNTAFLKKFEKEVLFFKEKITYDIQKFLFVDNRDVTLLKELAIGLDDLIEQKIKPNKSGSNNTNNSGARTKKIRMLRMKNIIYTAHSAELNTPSQYA